MREKLQTTLGFYRPSFFKMQVNVVDDLTNLNTLADIPSAVYFHEYIHFLQDITTTFGFTNISTVVDYIKYVNDSARSGTTREFPVPVIVKPSPGNDVYFNNKLKKEYVGSVDDITIATITAISKIQKTITVKKGNIELENIILDYSDSTGTIAYHHFGAHCIIESMAYLMENSIYPGILPAPPDFPYKSAEKIVAHEYPILSLNPLNIIALCDISLMMFNPGEYFFSMLDKMKTENYLPPTPEAIYQYCFNNTHFNFNGTQNLNELFIYTSYFASQQLSDYFTTPTFGDNSIWVNYTLSMSAYIRLANPYFILQIARGGKIQTNMAFMQVFKKIGSPMVSDLNGIGTFFSPLQSTHDIEPQYLWAISQIYSLYTKSVEKNNKKCEMKLWCKESCIAQNKLDPTDNNCYESPWLKSTEATLCPFATVWTTWDMTKEVPV
jgi:hypothetical protein